MRLISLNLWGGRVFKPLINFISKNKETADIFCFQEILNNSFGKVCEEGFRANLLSEIAKILSDFNLFYVPYTRGFNIDAQKINYDLETGVGIFVKKDFKIIAYEENIISGKIFTKLRKGWGNAAVLLLTISFEKEGKKYFINTTHGTPMPGDKLDTPKRLRQSKKILSLMKKQKGFKVLCGDFNLLPGTESIKIINKSYKNLILDFKIKSTRSTLNPFKGLPNEQKFADYTFVSSGLKIQSFKVPSVKISDHLPMMLEFLG